MRRTWAFASWLLAAAVGCGGAVEAPVKAPVEPAENSPERLITGLEFGEGPLWLPGEGLIFSDVRGNAILRADGAVYRKPSGKSNGLVLGPQGRLIACEHWNRRVSRTNAQGEPEPIAGMYEGKRFNSPNDLTLRQDGTIIFTDPDYGLEGRTKELAFQGVYALDPGGRLKLLTSELETPNGVALSPGEETLYVADSGHDFIQAFDIAPDASLSNGRRFCECPGPDGMETGPGGRLWVAANDGVRIYSASGKLADTLELPETPATNLAFGGEGGDMLFVTTPRSVYRLRLGVEE